MLIPLNLRYDMGPLDPLVLFVGRLATQKGPDLLVQAVPMVSALLGAARLGSPRPPHSPERQGLESCCRRWF